MLWLGLSDPHVLFHIQIILHHIIIINCFLGAIVAVNVRVVVVV